MEGFVWETKGGIDYLRVAALAAAGPVLAIFSGRQGGVSPAPFASLNLAFHVGDAPENVSANRRRLSRVLGVNLASWVAADQVHGDRVARVGRSEAGRGACSPDDAIAATDALASDTAGVAIATCYADCVPLYFYDPANRVVALAHAGWQGTAAAIGAKTVAFLARNWGTRPADCLAAIGPAIGPCCYQVDDRVAAAIRQAMPARAGEVLVDDGPGHWRLDLWRANRLILLAAGIRPHNLSVAGLCTACGAGSFFSHRRDGEPTGRMAAVMALG